MCMPFETGAAMPSFTSSLSVLEAVTQYVLVEDGLRQAFGEDFLLDLEVCPWCADLART